jgi:PAS domain S-box-containing protein
MRNPAPNPDRAAWRLAGIYLAVAGAWILFSDRLLLWLVRDPARLTGLQTAKGWFFVGCTALLLAWLVRRNLRRESEHLRQASALLESVIAHIPLYVFWKDRAGVYLGCNQRFAAVAGVGRPQNIAGKTDADLAWRPKEAAAILESERAIIATGKPLLDFEESQILADGREAVLLTRKVPLCDAAGSVIGVLGICADITLRKRAEEELLQSRDRAQAIIDAALDAVVEIDEAGRIISWNPSAAATFGWPAAEAVGRRLSETIIPPRYRQAHEQGLRNFLASGEGKILNRRIELPALHRDGHEFPVELTVTPIHLGERYTFTGFLRDMPRFGPTEEELAKALQECRERLGENREGTG